MGEKEQETPPAALDEATTRRIVGEEMDSRIEKRDEGLLKAIDERLSRFDKLPADLGETVKGLFEESKGSGGDGFDQEGFFSKLDEHLAKSPAAKPKERTPGPLSRFLMGDQAR